MSLLKLIGELFVIYLLYKLVFEFIIPVYNASKQMNKKMQAFQEKVKETQHTHPQQETKNKPESRPDSDDYIEFEEIKP
jgi:hypothetical protein